MRQAKEAGILSFPAYGISNTVPKVVRVRTLGPLLAQRQLKFRRNSPGASLLVQELKDFPHGSHDDCADGLEMAKRLGENLLSERTIERGGRRIIIGSPTPYAN